MRHVKNEQLSIILSHRVSLRSAQGITHSSAALQRRLSPHGECAADSGPEAL